MVHYYCTCSLNPSKDRDTRNGRTPYRKVLTDASGLCNTCNHYAVATNKEVNPRSGELYYYITGHKSKESKVQYKHNYYKDNYANRNG
jgi:hypothetical protein